MTDPIQAARQTTRRLGGRWHGSYGLAPCPAHKDNDPSLSITAGHQAVLFHCFAGCSNQEIMRALRSSSIDTRCDQPAPHRPLCSADRFNDFARSIWANSKPIPGTLAERYLNHRGLSALPFGRFHQDSVTVEDEKRLRIPALVLPITTDTGITAIQRVFLDPETGNKTPLLDKPKRILGSPQNGAIKLGSLDGRRLHLAEGFEDAASTMLLAGLPGCWAVCGIGRYSSITIPESVFSITIWSQHGEEARQAIERARHHLTRNGRALTVVLPPNGGDWNDALRRSRT